MVRKQQSNSLQEGPCCNPFTANGTGWSKRGCTHNRKTAGRCCPAARQPCAFRGLAFSHKDRLPIAVGHPQSPHSSLQLPPSLARDAGLPTATCDEAALALCQAKDKGSCQLDWSSPAPTTGLALWHVLFPSLGQAHVACSTLE